jgi:hypothetical protein
MPWILFFLTLLISNFSLAQNRNQLETRHGMLVAQSGTDNTVVQLQGKPVLTLASSLTSLYRITAPNAANEYVIVEAWHPGLNCHYFFHLVEISAAGVTRASREFGECFELAGANFVEDVPVVQLKQPFIEGVPPRPALTSFIWKQGQIAQALESNTSCATFALAVKKIALRVKQSDASRRAVGEGHIQFFTAPSEACAIKGIFVVAGDSLTVSLRYRDFAFATYTNLKTGKTAEGWVRDNRVAVPAKQ